VAGEARATPVGVRVLRSGDVGSYKSGCFYSEAMSGVPYELGLLHRGVGFHDEKLTGMGEVEGGYDMTLRALTLLHETSHLVQDLNLGVAVESDLLLDEALGLLVHLLQSLRDRDEIRLPMARYSADLGETAGEYLDLVRDRANTARMLVDDTVVVTFSDEPGVEYELSAAVLMEGLAAGHAARALRTRCTTDEELDHLAEVGDLVQVLPEQLGPPYDVARRLFVHALGWSVPSDGPAWPRDTGSPADLVDVGSAFLADIACHIPPIEVVASRVRAGENAWPDFLPGYRYLSALAAVRSAGGFPDAPPGGPDAFYPVLFDLVAQAHGWPSWEETSQAWLGKLAQLKQLRRSASDAFRFRLLVERSQKPAISLLADPLAQCWKQVVPVLHLTPNGVKILQGVLGAEQGLIIPFEQPLTPLEWLATTPDPWEDLPAQVDFGTAMRAHSENAMPLFLQEVVSRTIGRSFQEAVVDGAAFSCPYARVGCRVATEGCAELTRLGGLPSTGCAVRHWLEDKAVDPEALVWVA
jgi:hypothetical protein